MLTTSENTEMKTDIPNTKVGLWALFNTFIVKILAPIFVSCSAKSHLLKVLEMKESCGWQLTKSLWTFAELGAQALLGLVSVATM